MNIIEVKNLSKDYKYKVRNEEKGFLYNLFNEQEKVVKAVNNISFNVEEEEKVTIFLTSHDTEDIQSICDRCVIINHGKIIIDTSTKQLISDYVKNKNIIITPSVEFIEFPELSAGMTYIKKSKNQVTVGVNTEKIHTQKALQELIKVFDIDDVNIDNESLENIIRSIYEKN